MAKSIDRISERMLEVPKDSFRYHVLDTARNFKTSWIDLGRALYTVWHDKKYKEWGYQSFEAYVAKEIGIRRQTSQKLLKSYSFLETEEPQYLSEDYADTDKVRRIPDYESIDILRRAKSKRLDEDDYLYLREKVFNKGGDPKNIRKDLTAIIRQRKEVDPQTAFQNKKGSQIRRLVATLKSIKKEVESSSTLPSRIIKELNRLIEEISGHIT